VATGAAGGEDDCSAKVVTAVAAVLLLAFVGLAEAKSADAEVFDPVFSLVKDRCVVKPPPDPGMFGGAENVPAADGEGAPAPGLANVPAAEDLLELEKVAAGDVAAPPDEFWRVMW